jgi:hypothetical protein
MRSRTLLVAASVVLGVLVSAATCVSNSNTEVPVALKEQAECMYHVLTKLPAVNKPNISYVISEQFIGQGRWNHPVVEYLATQRDGAYPRRFEAFKPIPGNYKGYWFRTWFAGSVPPGFDMHLMESIIETWKAKCHADVEWEVD